MDFLRSRWYVCLLVAPLYAAPINVSADSSVTLQTGDTLTFAVSAWSYQSHASALGAPADPSYLSFSLLTDPLLGALDLGVSVQSYSGAASAPVTDATQSSGYFQGFLYKGSVSMESGSLNLSPGLSSQLFSGPAVLLEVENLGGAVTLGLSPYTLMQSLDVSLSGGGFSVGGVVASATLQPAQSFGASPDSLVPVDPLNTDISDTPEPPSALLLALGACLILLARLRKPAPTSRTPY